MSPEHQTLYLVLPFPKEGLNQLSTEYTRDFSCSFKVFRRSTLDARRRIEDPCTVTLSTHGRRLRRRRVIRGGTSRGLTSCVLQLALHLLNQLLLGLQLRFYVRFGLAEFVRRLPIHTKAPLQIHGLKDRVFCAFQHLKEEKMVIRKGSFNTHNHAMSLFCRFVSDFSNISYFSTFHNTSKGLLYRRLTRLDV